MRVKKKTGKFNPGPGFQEAPNLGVLNEIMKKYLWSQQILKTLPFLDTRSMSKTEQ